MNKKLSNEILVDCLGTNRDRAEKILDAVVNKRSEIKTMRELAQKIVYLYGKNVPETLNMLAQLYSSDSWKVRSIVAFAFEKIGETHPLDVLPLLKKIGADKYWGVRDCAQMALRTPIQREPTKVIPVLSEWAEDENENVRRLVAESLRLRGVWVKRIDLLLEKPEMVIQILAKLRSDKSLYVRKAVANNLNDYSRKYPDLVLATVNEWLKDGDENTKWIAKRACRSLAKEVHKNSKVGK